MKAAFRLIALFGGHILAVLLLARGVRNASNLFDADFGAAVAYGIPAVFVFVACLMMLRTRSSVLQKRVFSLVAALLVMSAGHVASLVVLQRTDMWLTARYIQRMQVRLHEDPRFKDVRLIGYSDDFILFPYIPIGGSVANEEDLRELNRLLKDSHPPAFAGAGSYLIRKTQEEEGF